jgi:hypothetical protein
MKNKRSKILLVAGFFAVCALFAACATATMTVSEGAKGLPDEQLCQIDIGLGLTVISFDNNPVKWKGTKGLGTSSVKIPSGNHRIVCNYSLTWDSNYNLSRGTYDINTRKASGLIIEYEFFPGVIYELRSYSVSKNSMALRVSLKHLQEKLIILMVFQMNWWENGHGFSTLMECNRKRKGNLLKQILNNI